MGECAKQHCGYCTYCDSPWEENKMGNEATLTKIVESLEKEKAKDDARAKAAEGEDPLAQVQVLEVETIRSVWTKHFPKQYNDTMERLKWYGFLTLERLDGLKVELPVRRRLAHKPHHKPFTKRFVRLCQEI